MKSTIFICQSEESIQKSIKESVEKFLKSEGLYSKESLQNIMDGRLEDLNTDESNQIYRDIVKMISSREEDI